MVEDVLIPATVLWDLEGGAAGVRPALCYLPPTPTVSPRKPLDAVLGENTANFLMTAAVEVANDVIDFGGVETALYCMLPRGFSGLERPIRQGNVTPFHIGVPDPRVAAHNVPEGHVNIGARKVDSEGGLSPNEISDRLSRHDAGSHHHAIP